MSSAPISFVSNSVDETENMGRLIGRYLEPGDLICLSGTLGAGKTAFVRGLALGWGAVDPVTSPTFTLINVYQRSGEGPQFCHVDCYRLSGSIDASTIGLEDVLDETAIVVIEWPERIQEVLPEDRLWIELVTLGSDRRSLALTATGQRAAMLLGYLVDQLP